MSRLFISVYLDEDVSVLLAKLIRSRALSAMTTQEAEQLGKNDAEQLEFASRRRMAIVTHNRTHFEELARQYIATGRNHCGIIIATRRPPYELARRLLVLLNRVSADEMDNQVLYI